MCINLTSTMHVSCVATSFQSSLLFFIIIHLFTRSVNFYKDVVCVLESVSNDECNNKLSPISKSQHSLFHNVRKMKVYQQLYKSFVELKMLKSSDVKDFFSDILLFM